MRRYRKRPKKIRLGSLLLLLLLVAVFLVSCVAGSGPLWVKGFFGIDLKNYRAETPLETLPVDGDQSAVLADVVDLLIDGSIELSSFSGSKQAVKLYRDRILVSMLRRHYSLYNCNPELCAAAKEAYPHRTLCTLIPKADFESFVFRNFGGNSVSHKSGEVFEYLSSIKCYTSPVPVRKISVDLRVTGLVRTENTYRMNFTLSDQSRSADYIAVFLFRQDGSFYLDSLARS